MERKIMPTTWFLCFLALTILLNFLIGEKKVIPFPYNQFGWIPLVLGIVFNLWTDNLFKKHETTVKPYLKPSCFITKGPFCISRNPMYLGMLLILTGTAILLKSVLLLSSSLLFVFVMEGFYIRKEELFMTEQFGENFLKYKRKVRRWL
ncbi:Protein-S-isoprenylcysteine O-methyltransferase Ste14 [Tangfeifania diversioriginum]|uniref:Protein-S-isoprenylcysteine O-methyltransferase Ste14 n=1 Tax=Tangfeifania diversioriginum TaxID=1168035 RepID=A0A1M6L583_9BACT|nr:isoprenylcysteine carboxylmethyltransferase family protein [Tangfeifania diversioriginum]SHJ66294.1 Protein-S-isoprenylcysteine O-methyltransferase Ste14 [Tangfeifania diversioriginum]